MTIAKFRQRLAFAGWALVLSAPAAAGAAELGSYPVDPAKVSISGISSGAYMANQFHIAHSQLVMGAGLVAGGLYGCVPQTNASVIEIMDGPCMRGRSAKPLPPAKDFIKTIAELAPEEGGAPARIDTLAGIKGDRVYLFTGDKDKTVRSVVMERAQEVYEALGAASQLVVRKGAAHTWATDKEGYGQPCDLSESPYVGKCKFDLAGEILNYIYGPLQPPSTETHGQYLAFSQKEFAGDWEKSGLHGEGHVYVPEGCKPGDQGEPGGKALCALHVVLHGCHQSEDELKDGFYKNIGINEWADSNNIVVLYPQARKLTSPPLSSPFKANPQGCWNWWGYADDGNFAYKTGVQINAIHKMIQRVMGQENRI